MQKISTKLIVICVFTIVFSISGFTQKALHADDSNLGAQVTITNPSSSRGVGTTFTVSIQTTNVTGLGVTGFDGRLTFDPAVIQPTGPNFGCSLTGTVFVGTGANVLCNYPFPVAGSLAVTTSGIFSASGSGSLLNVTFVVVGGEGSSTPLAWSTFMLNEGNPTSETVSGTINIFGTTSANVEVSGQVLDLNGMPIRNTRVLFIDSEGSVHNGYSNQFGFYHISGLRAGDTYIVTAAAKGRTFKSFSIDVVEDITGLNIFAEN